MYLIVSGRIAIRTIQRNEEVFITELGKGSFLGELALVDPEHLRSAHAVVTEPSRLIGFFKPDLEGILQSNPAMGVKILYQLSTVLGRRLLETTQRITALQNQQEKADHPPVLSPVVTAIERKGLDRTSAVGVIFGVASLIVIIGSLVATRAWEHEWLSFQEKAPGYYTDLLNQVTVYENKLSVSYPFVKNLHLTDTVAAKISSAEAWCDEYSSLHRSSFGRPAWGYSWRCLIREEEEDRLADFDRLWRRQRNRHRGYFSGHRGQAREAQSAGLNRLGTLGTVLLRNDWHADLDSDCGGI
ncbi:unnamed protein product [Sphagnum jensenii]|uniref:Cyclic nucleotide-binding domain-containing protein n=1 Tax=Sphagnum jensenii TaxID=128206 RepID=A0ABP0V727_9BRYO